jgi:hypothetical protein
MGRAGLWLLTVGAASGCLIPPCEDDFHGAHDGDRFTSTIIGTYDLEGGGQSCAALGDVAVGAELTWIAELDGPGDGCSDRVKAKVVSLSSGEVSEQGVLSLPNGCTGTLVVSVHALSSDADFLANDADDPSWYLVRRLEAPSAECFSGSAAPGSCVDAFVATSTR